MGIPVKYYTIQRKAEVLELFQKLQEDFGSIHNLILLGDPLSMHGRHKILILRGPLDLTIKIDGPGEAIYLTKYLLELIRDGKIKEKEFLKMKEIMEDYR